MWKSYEGKVSLFLVPLYYMSSCLVSLHQWLLLDVKKLHRQSFLILSVIMINVIVPVVSSGCEKVMKAKCSYYEWHFISLCWVSLPQWHLLDVRSSIYKVSLCSLLLWSMSWCQWFLRDVKKIWRQSVLILSGITLHVITLCVIASVASSGCEEVVLTKIHYAQCYYDQCHSASCFFRMWNSYEGKISLFWVVLYVIMQSVIAPVASSGFEEVI
jgi:hypothetical protein